MFAIVILKPDLFVFASISIGLCFFLVAGGEFMRYRDSKSKRLDE